MARENLTSSHPASKGRLTVAEYIDRQIALSGKRKIQIAKEAGFSSMNIVSMIAAGKSKLPMERIGKFAKAIGVDPVFLYKMIVAEYMPETYRAIQGMFDQDPLTNNERKIIDIVRQADILDPNPDVDKGGEKLLNFINRNMKGDNGDNFVIPDQDVEQSVTH